MQLGESGETARRALSECLAAPFAGSLKGATSRCNVAENAPTKHQASKPTHMFFQPTSRDSSSSSERGALFAAWTSAPGACELRSSAPFLADRHFD